MARTAHIVIIDEDPAARALMVDAYAGVGDIHILAQTDSLVYGYELVRQNRPNVVFIDLRSNPWKSLEVVNRIATYFRETLIVVSGFEVTLDTIMACMQAGAREYLQRPLQKADLLRVLEKHRPTLSVDRDQGDTSGRIVTVFSNKGGLGKTSIAVNLGLALSEVSHKPVALVDLNPHGDITTFLDLAPKQTLSDIARNIALVDETYLKSSLAEFRYQNAHLFVLADPLRMEEAEELTGEQINTVLSVLKSAFEYVVVDTSTVFDTKSLTALDLADTLLLVATMNLPSIRSSQRVLSLFKRLGYDAQKIKLLINRYVAGDEITVEDVEDTLEHPVFWKIPNNYQVVSSAINRGIPIPAIENGSGLYDSFLQLARQIGGIVEPPSALDDGMKAAAPPRPSGLLNKLFSRPPS